MSVIKNGLARFRYTPRRIFGTVDSWLLYNLTKGKVHATDVSNASRTLLFNINSLEWDNVILEKQRIGAVKDIAVAFYKSKPTTVNYSYIVK